MALCHTWLCSWTLDPHTNVSHLVIHPLSSQKTWAMGLGVHLVSLCRHLAGIWHMLVMYPSMNHGFINPESPSMPCNAPEYLPIVRTAAENALPQGRPPDMEHLGSVAGEDFQWLVRAGGQIVHPHILVLTASSDHVSE